MAVAKAGEATLCATTIIVVYFTATVVARSMRHSSKRRQTSRLSVSRLTQTKHALHCIEHAFSGCTKQHYRTTACHHRLHQHHHHQQHQNQTDRNRKRLVNTPINQTTSLPTHHHFHNYPFHQMSIISFSSTCIGVVNPGLLFICSSVHPLLHLFSHHILQCFTSLQFLPFGFHLFTSLHSL